MLPFRYCALLVADDSRRMKISHDPNNTTWTRSATTFGHKILTSQGWCPGDFLGAKGASHAEHYTTANASHIRVALKDDNLGLGAKRGSGQVEGQCTGLDAFQGLLGRLNGKSDGELLKEQESRDDLKRAMYTERRWGSVRFVRGGLLVGEKIQALDHSEATKIRRSSKHEGPLQPTAPPTSQSSRDEHERDAPSAAGVTMARKKKSKASRSHGARNDEDGVEANSVQPQTQLESPAFSSSDSTAAISSSMLEESSTSGENAAQEMKAKAERRRLKAERRAVRDAKRRRKMVPDISSTATAWDNPSELSSIVEGDAKAPKVPDRDQHESGTTVPTQSSTAMFAGGRHAVRRRYIQQKKLAVIDIKALNEVRSE